jgi:hypothetical protein
MESALLIVTGQGWTYLDFAFLLLQRFEKEELLANKWLPLCSGGSCIPSLTSPSSIYDLGAMLL